MCIDEATFVVTDTETTGSRPPAHRLIEIGAAKVVNGLITETFSQLINPCRPIPRYISALTGINDQMVSSQPAAADVISAYCEFLGDGVFVAHNVLFDQRFLTAECTMAGRSPIRNEALCTVRIARRILPALPSKSLDGLISHYGIAIKRRHRALDDALATAEAFIRMIRLLRSEEEVKTVADLIRFQYKRYHGGGKEFAHLKDIRERILPAIPGSPGVYRMFDRMGCIIYVGKAANLQQRVRSYFSGIELHPRHIKQLIKNVRDIRVEITPCEVNALIRESRLIKELKPRFNRALKEVHGYPFLRFKERAGRSVLTVCAFLADDGSDYFGPLETKDEAELMARVLGKIYRIEVGGIDHQREERFNPYGDGRHVTTFLNRLAITEHDGAEGVRKFLEGNSDQVTAILKFHMKTAAERLDYERAAWYRDVIAVVRKFADRRRLFPASVLSNNGIVIHRSDGAVELHCVRFGSVVKSISWNHSPSSANLYELERALAYWQKDPSGSKDLSYSRLDIDGIRIFAQWAYRERDNIAYLRWREDLTTDEILWNASGESRQRLASST